MASAAERMRLSRKRKKLGKMVIPWFEVTTQEIDYLRQRGYGARQGDRTTISEAVSALLQGPPWKRATYC